MNQNNYEVGYFLQRDAAVYPNRKAVVFGDRYYTYKELNDKVNILSNNMMKIGIKQGDRVAYLFNNSIESVIIWHATQKIGVAAVPLNTAFLAEDISYIFNTAKCTAVFYHEKFSTVIQTAIANAPSVKVLVSTEKSKGNGVFCLEELMLTGSVEEPDVKITGEDESLILFTSGTTGKPKAVARTQKIVREYAMMMVIDNGAVEQNENVLVTHLRLFHTGGWLNMMRMLALGGTIILIDKVEPAEIFTIIEEYKASQLFMLPPVMYNRLYQDGSWKNRDLSSIKIVFSSGGKCSLEYAKHIGEMFPNAVIRYSYGSTETCTPLGASITIDQIMERPELATTAGKINSLCEVRLVDNDGHEVSPGTVGEAIVRSSNVCRGYMNRPDLNETLFEKDGWFHTGDLMKQSEDGYFFIVDRMKDMIKTGGENVYAQEVETVLRDHPAIYDCAVIGIPDPKFQETVAVAIVLEPGKTLDPNEFTDFCKKHMATYKKPRYWAFMDALPVNAVNKIQKSVLREHLDWFSPILVSNKQ